MKPICVPCQRFYRMKTSGLYFIEGMPVNRIRGRRVEPGTAEPENWLPYKLWAGDLWACEGCGHELIAGTGSQPIAEHYQPEFAERRAKLNATFQVNDC